MSQNNNSPLFDNKTILAMVVIGAFYLGWNTYLSKKYPKPQAVVSETEKPSDEVKVSSDTKVESSQSGHQVVNNNDGLAKQGGDLSVQANSFKEFGYEDDHVKFQVNSLGMGLKSFTLKNFTDRNGSNVMIGQSDSTNQLFSMKIGDQIIPFEVKEESKGSFVGIAQVGNIQIKRELVFNSELGSFTSKVSFVNADEKLASGISFSIPDQIHPKKSASFFLPSYDVQDFYIGHSAGKSDAVHFNGIKEDLKKEFSNSSLISVGSQYFASALVDRSDILPTAQISTQISKNAALAEVVYKPVNPKGDIVLNQTLYVGPKSVDKMQKIDSELATIINYGWLASIAKILLAIMKLAYSVVGNWGLAIISLTLIVRLLVLPFNIMSMRSMKAMQRIQPKINSLKERYKDDPVKMNQEMMALMKENKANPLGGCLPMVLQIPIFFALWRVINSSIELYQSPFFGWITDLSLHDKFYIFPVLNGVVMFLQQKLTPSTMDPAQARIMMFMPLIFSVFMLQVPSGLALYMFVSTTFGVVQQFIMLRDSKARA